MLFSFFKHDYVARRLKEDVYSGGYAAPGGHEDFVVTLNVQPLSSDDSRALPEGERTIKPDQGHRRQPVQPHGRRDRDPRRPALLRREMV